MVWKRYDSDGNGIIDAAEFTSLIGDVMCWDQINEDKPDPWEVKNFLQQIDENTTDVFFNKLIAIVDSCYKVFSVRGAKTNPK